MNDKDAQRKGRGSQPTLVLPGYDRERLDAEAVVKVARARNPMPRATLGDTGISAKVAAGDRFGPGMLVIPYDEGALEGIDPATVRLFRAERGSMVPVWNSGVDVAHQRVWGRVGRPGTYVAIGLPLDPVIRELVRSAGEARRFAEHDDDKVEVARATMSALDEISDEDLARVRGAVATVMTKTAVDPPRAEHIEFGEGGHFTGLRLPGGDLAAFRERVRNLEPGPAGLPEELLFHPPYDIHDELPPWQLRDIEVPWHRLLPSLDDRLVGIRHLVDRLRLCWLLNSDWWMYHADERHTGVARCSSIRAANVSTLRLVASVTTDSSVVTIPTIVGGKVYIGSGGDTGINATLYKIDLATGAVDATFPVSGAAYYPYSGIGGSPAVTGGRVYFSTVHGKVYCLDAATFTQVWVVDLKHPDPAHNQPVNNPNGDCWSSPLVVHGRVYVAVGEGEGGSSTYGFVYCLDAATGQVLWLFCTCAFTHGSDNAPNVIPATAVGVTPLPAMFTAHANPPEAGSSPWSSFAYDSELDRVYIGTGNSTPDTPLPDPRYGSGVLSLDATTGEFRGFFQPDPADSYRPGDLDVDVPAAPMIYDRGDRRVLCIGSKNGSFFLLDPDTLEVLDGGSRRRQLLPKTTGGDIIPTVAAGTFGGWDASGENKWGVMGTAAVHAGLGKIYVGLGGYSGIGDSSVTPFVRALDWNTLDDAWPTAVNTVNGRQVVRYTTARPPLYTSSEAGLSSPAVCNDVVFVTTSKTALYALDAATGTCLWSAPGMPPGGWPTYCLGPAVSGKYVVVGAGHQVRIYALTTPNRIPPIRDIPIPELRFPPKWPLPWPPPDPWGPVSGRPGVIPLDPRAGEPPTAG
jgi:outer membrane protein assembly factor BamB